MPDPMKIKEGMQHCGMIHICKGCPYRGNEDCTGDLFKDALAYIKALEERTGKDD